MSVDASASRNGTKATARKKRIGVIGSLVWPNGNQVFAIEPVPAAWSAGLPTVAGRRRPEWERGLFYGFVTE